MNEPAQERVNLYTILEEVRSNVPNGRTGGYLPISNDHPFSRMIALTDRLIRMDGSRPEMPISDETQILRKAAYFAGLDNAVLDDICRRNTNLEIPVEIVPILKKIFRAGMEYYFLYTKYPNARRMRAIEHAFDKMRELYGKPTPKA